MKGYNFAEIEPKWQKLWEQTKLYQPDIKKAKNAYYNLWMFPYPSGARMHVGHAYASTGADIHGRFMRMQGHDVFQPMGFDAFGIHGENYAIKVGKHPKGLMDELCDRYRDEQFKRMGHGYDWSHEVRTYDPRYYKWTQWIFIQLYKKGLAERKEAAVNWCPSCKTVLADEQVLQGHCERCDSQVEQKRLKQWFFKITDYADQLLNNLSQIDWPKKIKMMQHNWIGKSEGAKIRFPKADRKKDGKGGESFIEVFTTRPDTLFGSTFFVLAAESDWVKRLTTNEKRVEVDNYVKQVKSLTTQQRAQREEKTGVFTGGYVVNPATNDLIPVYVADYVLFEYGGGAVMGVPAHDQRDFEFAKKFNIPVREVVASNTSEGELTEAFTGQGKMKNSGQFNGFSSHEAKGKIVAWLSSRQLGEGTVQYKLRDWCISRQRYWGVPIPIIYCDACGEMPVSEDDLPVLLPQTQDWRPTGTDKSPLAAIDEFVNVSCPECGGRARRETDVCDNFLDSAWYYYAYPVHEPTNNQAHKMSVPVESAGDYPFKQEVVKRWLPVDMYVGGAEHSLLHLMYTRFITMAFADLNLVDFDEPFKTFFAHGLITKDGFKMSKSKGNIVNPDEYVERVGADAFRSYLMFLGPYDAGGDFTDGGLQGMVRFLNKVWRIASQAQKMEAEEDRGRLQIMHETIMRVTRDVESFSFNTALAAMMEWVKKITRDQLSISHQEAEVLLRLLAPFAPHITEELWQIIKGFDKDGFARDHSIHRSPWPKYDSSLAQVEEVTVVVQVNGKMRGKLLIKRDTREEVVKDKALQLGVIKKYLGDSQIKRVFYVPNRLINFVL